MAVVVLLRSGWGKAGGGEAANSIEAAPEDSSGGEAAGGVRDTGVGRRTAAIVHSLSPDTAKNTRTDLGASAGPSDGQGGGGANKLSGMAQSSVVVYSTAV